MDNDIKSELKEMKDMLKAIHELYFSKTALPTKESLKQRIKAEILARPNRTVGRG